MRLLTVGGVEVVHCLDGSVLPAPARRDFLFVGCERGHDMVSVGGCNAGCHADCSCSVPVLRCTRCGDCDYGDNAEAREVRANCAAIHGEPAERFGDPA